MPKHIATLALVTLLLCLISQGRAEALPCMFPKHYPEVEWKPFTAGVRLGLGHAIVTCEEAVVRIRSNGKFLIYGDWEEGAKGYIGKISERTLIRIPWQHSTVPQLEVELLFATRHVYYSTDSETLKRLRVRSRPGLSESETIHIAERANQAKEQMKTIEQEEEWTSLTLDQELVPWDMLWIRAKSGVEIEILEGGPYYHANAGNTVLDSWGEYTYKFRYPPKTLWIMVPKYFQRAKVNTIIGEVWISKDTLWVQDFYDTYGLEEIWEEPWIGSSRKKWREMLTKPDLEVPPVY